MSETELAELLMQPRTCRCCGRSISFTERCEVDENFKPGLKVCPGCILHFKRVSCLFNEPDEYCLEVSMAPDDPELISRLRREAMAELMEE